MSNNIEIFLNNKLLSCDTIVPFIMSLQKIDRSIGVNYYKVALEALNGQSINPIYI